MRATTPPPACGATYRTFDYDEQLEMRGSIADRLNQPPYNVLGGQVLKALCKRRPVDLATLSTVDGMAHKKVADHGADIIKVCVCVGGGVLFYCLT